MIAPPSTNRVARRIKGASKTNGMMDRVAMVTRAMKIINFLLSILSANQPTKRGMANSPLPSQAIVLDDWA